MWCLFEIYRWSLKIKVASYNENVAVRYHTKESLIKSNKSVRGQSDSFNIKGISLRDSQSVTLKT